jgi:hypothetical protein
LSLCTLSFGHCVVLRYTDSDCPFGVFLWVNCKWFLYCQNKWNIYFKKNYPWDKIWTNLHINRATEEKQTSSVGKLYTIQFIQKQNWKRIYERFMPFFLYTRVETWKYLFYDCTVIQQNHIGVKKLHGSPLSTNH